MRPLQERGHLDTPAASDNAQDDRSRDAEDQDIDLPIIHATWPIRINFLRSDQQDIHANVEWLSDYNHWKPRQALGYKTP